MILLDAIAENIGRVSGQQTVIRESQPITGGCINQALKISEGDRSWFVKTNQAVRVSMFEAEADALSEMAPSGIRVPRVVCYGVAAGQSYLVLEYMALTGTANPSLLGQQLAVMHQLTAAQYGWHRNNTIGSTPQMNTCADDWPGFWRQHRLGFQLQLAAQNGYGGELQDLGEALMQALPGLFDGYRPPPSMLHGDLWSGNAAALTDGTPVIFDPALYYGDRETDIAMTELFGGFGPRFYAAYNAVWPLDAGYKHRKILYNLYHILNHLNLFGGGYRQQALAMMRQLMAVL